MSTADTPALQYRRRKRRLAIHAALFVIANGFFVGQWLLLRDAPLEDGDPRALASFWPAWLMLPWGVVRGTVEAVPWSSGEAARRRPARGLRVPGGVDPFRRLVFTELCGTGLDIRAEMLAGEVDLQRRGMAGIGVHIDTRVMSESEPSQILVSRTVHDLVTARTPPSWTWDPAGSEGSRGNGSSSPSRTREVSPVSTLIAFAHSLLRESELFAKKKHIERPRWS